jgi:hypothetical protein
VQSFPGAAILQALGLNPFFVVTKISDVGGFIFARPTECMYVPEEEEEEE